MAYKQHHKFSLEILPKKTFLVYLANEKLGNLLKLNLSSREYFVSLLSAR